MKAVLISIKPKWCNLIANSKKTIEVRKTRPKIETPFKCYIYCTKAKDVSFWTGPRYSYADDHSHNAFDRCGNGTVIGEFICNKIDHYTDEVVNASSMEDYSGWNDFELEKACIHPDDLEKYADGNDLYGWHISNLKIYDTPKGLSEFVVVGDCDCLNCWRCKWLERGNGYNVEDDCLLPYENDFNEPLKPLFRPPRSWCYV